MKTISKQVIQKISLNTANRGNQTFIISEGLKGYYAHELGELTQWAKAFNTDEQKAHSINPTVKRGNQYGRYFRPKPYNTIREAITAINERANQTCWYF